MAEVQARVRERLRSQLAAESASPVFDDPALFAEVEAVLRDAAATPDAAQLILPELLGEPDTWRLTTRMQYGSHRGRAAGSLFVWVKQRVLMPGLRWLFEYSRDNFGRQRRTNHVVFACLQALALEIVLLRREVHRLSASSAVIPSQPPPSSSPESRPGPLPQR